MNNLESLKMVIQKITKSEETNNLESLKMAIQKIKQTTSLSLTGKPDLMTITDDTQ